MNHCNRHLFLRVSEQAMSGSFNHYLVPDLSASEGFVHSPTGDSVGATHECSQSHGGKKDGFNPKMFSVGEKNKNMHVSCFKQLQ